MDEESLLRGAAWTKAEIYWDEQQERRKTFPWRSSEKEGRHWEEQREKRKTFPGRRSEKKEDTFIKEL